MSFWSVQPNFTSESKNIQSLSYKSLENFLLWNDSIELTTAMIKCTESIKRIRSESMRRSLSMLPIQRRKNVWRFFVVMSVIAYKSTLIFWIEFLINIFHTLRWTHGCSINFLLYGIIYSTSPISLTLCTMTDLLVIHMSFYSTLSFIRLNWIQCVWCFVALERKFDVQVGYVFQIPTTSRKKDMLKKYDIRCRFT